MTWTADEVKEYLDGYVSRRNKIVHGGDLKGTGTAAQPIQRPYVELAAVVVQAVGDAISTVVDRTVRTA